LAEIRLPPTLLKVYEWMRAHACEHWTRREVAEALGISYSTARYALEELATRGLITKHVAWPPRRIFYHAYPPLPPAVPPPPKPPPGEELIGDEECSGYDIWFNLDTETYMVREPKTYRLIREERKICMELTYSIETHEGHEVPLIVEITTTTLVEKMGLSDLINVAKDIDRRLKDWLIENNWGNVIHAVTKTGEAFNGEKHIEETGWYPWIVPDYPRVYVYVEKKEPRRREYEGEFTV
jgi:ribosomal protein S25